MEFDNLDELYHDAILDHYRNPRHQGTLEDPDIIADGVNPFCGDEIHIQIGLDDRGRVGRIGFQGQGCSINQATGSMLSEVIEGRDLEEIEALSARFNDMMLGEMPPDEEWEQLGDMGALSGVRQFPVRIKCALLAWSALDDGIRGYRRKH